MTSLNDKHVSFGAIYDVMKLVQLPIRISKIDEYAEGWNIFTEARNNTTVNPNAPFPKLGGYVCTKM
ncbi:hypothetical protein MALU111345_08050 [Marinicrinis lubricantis]